MNLVGKGHSSLSLARRCELLSFSRSSFYYRSKPGKEENLKLMRLIDEQFLKTPFFGVRQMSFHLRSRGIPVNVKRVRRLMRLMGLMPIYQKPKTSQPHPEHKRYPYLLHGLDISRSNQVWCADITYIPMARGYFYLVAVMDWASRKILAWRLSNGLDSDFCCQALHEALGKFSKPDIFNSDQGRQFTSRAFTQILLDANVRISMDGRGRCIDNVFIERLWRSLKYEAVYLHAWEDGTAARRGIGQWMEFYNRERPHKAHQGQTPDRAYFQTRLEMAA